MTSTLQDIEIQSGNSTSATAVVTDVNLEVAELEEEPEEEIDHEKILTESFQCAIRFKSSEFKLPVIVSSFMKVMHSCW